MANSGGVLKVMVIAGLSRFTPKQNHGRVGLKIREVPYVVALMSMSHHRVA
jgi:hypothetical protein